MKSSRRKFLVSSAAVTASPFVAKANFADQLEPLSEQEIPAVVTEVGSPAAQQFGARSRANGLAVHEIFGDVTNLWVDVLHQQWRELPRAIAGLTSAPALFCLERLAWDYGMRVIHHATHSQTSGLASRHCAETRVWQLDSQYLAAANTDWPEYIADTVAAVRLPSAARSGPSAVCDSHAIFRDGDVLHSWVIAPSGAPSLRAAS